MWGWVVFHNRAMIDAHLSPCSPLVAGVWQRPLVDALLESRAAGGFGNEPTISCGAFVAWCLSQQPSVVGELELLNLPGAPWPGDDWETVADAWFDRTLASFMDYEYPPVLVDLQRFMVTHRGIVLSPQDN